MRATGERAERPAAPSAAVPARVSEPDRARALAGAIGNRAFTSVARAVRTRAAIDPITSGAACFTHALAQADRFAADLNAHVVYDEETRRWNDNEGRTVHDWGGALYDAWGYCYIAACHAQGNPDWMTWLLGNAYDGIAVGLHEAWGAWSFGWIAPSTDRDTTAQDAFNRDVGIEIASEVPVGDLYQPCFDAMTAGRLDLSAAGVARGRALTTV